MLRNRGSFLFDTLTQTVSGVIVALFIGVAALFTADLFFSTPQLSGLWEFELLIEQSDYSRYQGLRVTYVATIAQGGMGFEGFGDKFSEQGSEAESPMELTGSERTPIHLTGYIEKKFLSEDKVFITISEEGSARRSSTFHELTVLSDYSMKGIFRSTISDAVGTVVWVKD